MSIASEITRIQNAKSALKTSINAKTDQSHQITNETIDNYSSFVDSITSGGEHTGAYKVSSVSEMNALTDMENRDLCIVVEEQSYPTEKDYTKLNIETVKKACESSLNTSVINNIFNTTTYAKYAMIQSTPTGDMLTFMAITPKNITTSQYDSYSTNILHKSQLISGYAVYYNLTTKQKWANADTISNANVAMFDNNSAYPVTNPLNTARTVQSSFSSDLTVTNNFTNYLSFTDYDTWGLINFNITKYSTYKYENNTWTKIFENFESDVS